MAHAILSAVPKQSLPTESGNRVLRDERCLALVADACFEMFTIRELKKPQVILPELRAAFPECCDEEIVKAVGMALSWKRLLKSAGRPVH